MSDQDTTFEALAASAGDYAIDSEWMGDSPPALTVDFIQNPQNQIHHIHQIGRDGKSQPHNFRTFNSAAAGGPGSGKPGISKDRLLDDPALTLSRQPPASSPESLLSSFQDSSSDISSSKQTSMTALSSLVGGTSVKKSRGRSSKGSAHSANTKASSSSSSRPSGLAAHTTGKQQQQQPRTAVVEDDIIMTDEGLQTGDDAQHNWSFGDYICMDNEQDDDDDENNQSINTEGDSFGTIDPKSIQHASNFGGVDEQLLQDAAALRASLKSEGAIGSDLSPYSGGPSPLEFVSATSSPTPDDPTIPAFNASQLFSTGGIFNTAPTNGSAQQHRKGHNKAASQQQYSLSQSMNNLNTAASREVSPVSNFVFGQGPSPQGFMQNSQSPIDNSDFRFGFLGGTGADSMQMAPNFLFPESVPTSPNSQWQASAMQQQQQQLLNTVAAQMPLYQQNPGAQAQLLNNQRPPLRFSVGIEPHKSRVETQIPVTILLSSLPPDVTKLHLPPHTISKPKLLAKNAPEHSPDTLELYTMVVCTSAMEDEGNRQRALKRAAAATYGPQARPSEDGSEDSEGVRPADGGEVWICNGCIQRERKRANRKKSKKPEDDEGWSRDEHRRIIIFNTNEIKDWQHPTAATMSPQGDNAAIVIPMRITCYCRHHGEKSGFQVIFTLKDFRGRVLAQTLSRSIMITDDHKTPTAASAGSASAAPSIADGDASTGDVADVSKPSSTATLTAASASKPVSKSGKTKSQGGAQSAADMSALKRGSVTFSAPDAAGNSNANTFGASAASASSAAAIARTLSRPASPDGLKGHSAKKRKSSAGVPKVPTGLAMTRIETSPQLQQATVQNMPNVANRLAASSTSPVAQFSSNNTAFLSPPSGFVPDTMSAAVDMALMAGGSGDPDIDSLAGIVPMNAEPIATGPLTPNSHTDQANVFGNGNRSTSFDNLALSQTPMFSAPTSTHPSRAPSPNGLRGSMHMFQQQLFQQQQQQLQQQLTQAQFSQQFQNSLFNIPMAMSQPATNQTSQPVVHKIIPAEGPKSGGIEVTILGSSFYQGLDVMFGDQRATTTTFWGESSLVCLVPPSSIAGHVPVTLRQSNQRGTTQPFAATTQARITFKYLDDDEQQLLRAALTVLSRKMTGKIEDAQDVARRIIGSETSTWGTSGGGTSGGSSAGSTRNAAGNSNNLALSPGSPNFETHLLKVLELIDLDDSSNQTRLNMQRRTTGHSMLHLACVLGMHRFVAGLLARGANPDVRDNGGYTPLHLAALNNQPEIVRRLIHAGADPTMRTLSGLTASEVTTSRDVLRAIKRFERHARSRSGGSLHSLTNSTASLRSLWEPMGMSTIRRRASGAAADRESTEDSENSSRAEVDSSSYAASGDDEASNEQEEEGDEEWLDMRPGSRVMSRGSMSIHGRRGVRDASQGPDPTTAAVAAAAARGANVPTALASPAAAAVSAFKDQLSAHFQQLVAQIPQIPNNPLPDYYQAYLNSAAFQRISSLVPNINISGAIGSRPNSSGHNSGAGGGVGGSGKEFEGRWWDLSSLMAGSAPPPSYEEIFPHKTGDMDTKTATAAAAAAEAEADAKCSTLYDNQRVEVEVKQQTVMTATTATTTTVEDNGEEAFEDEEEHLASTPVLQIGRKHQITKEQQENFRRVHKEKRKGLSSDTFLYTVWIPILLGVLLLWLSGARAWDFFPSVTFNVPYATSLSNPIRPTGTGSNNNGKTSNANGASDKQILPPAPAEAVVHNNDGQDVLGAIAGIVA
ncbi:SPT3 Dosage dependent suppressor of Ty-induced promoter mutations-like protein [Sporothrix bragantina]|uniref:SPT3 Dosage dependent suppressor of Ty-induced promoter mutations-like protein n=1 Tax=Sporothrix bragantina TaxID=671064 RepID=A0ABP0BBL7_9PEZI